MFRAHDPIEGRLVALKWFRLDLTPEQTADLAAALEDLVAQQPRHPTIAAALAAGVEGSHAYLAQEYVTGDALDAVLRQSGRPSMDATLVNLGRLAEALDRAAGEGIHHGALHPRDVLMEGGEVRMIDIGVAQALQRAGLRPPVRPPYSAPERLDDRSWGGAADIFALGAITFELVTGRRIVGPGPPSLWADSVPGADVNALSDVFGRALAMEPGARFASASDLIDALRPILARIQVPIGVPLEAPAPDAAPDAGPNTIEDDARNETDNLPVFLSGGEGRTVRYDSGGEREDDVSADLPLIAGAGSAPVFHAAADDRPGFFPPRDRDVDHEGPGGPFLDVDTASTPRTASPALSGPLWSAPQPDAVPQRRPFLPLIVALVVGVGGGFGWGYWTAWRAAAREAPATARATGPAAPSSPSPATTPQRVEEPRVLGEGTTAPTPRSNQRPSAAGPSTAPAPAPPAPAKAAPGQARRERRAVQAPPLSSGAAPATKRASGDQRVPTGTPAATTGSLLVESRPLGAQVSVDGQVMGTTPLTLPEVQPGAHRIVLEIPGFNQWITMVQVTAGNRMRVAASLEQVQQP